MQNLLLILAIYIATPFAFAEDSAEEIIRRKIENMAVNGLRGFEEKIYCTKSLSAFYRNRAFNLAWDPISRLQLIAALKKAGEEGLTPEDYHLQELLEKAPEKGASAFTRANDDLLLTDAFLLYTSHLISGKVNPETIQAEWHVTRREENPLALLEEAISKGKVGQSIEEVMPKHAVYQSLKRALKSYKSYLEIPWPVIPKGEVIKKGMTEERLPMVRERLFALGDLKEQKRDSLHVYDEVLFQAVQGFQKRHGLESDGSIGEHTIDALNISIEQRIQQILANLERWRWLPQEFGAYYIKVNIANFELEVFKEGKRERVHKVIAGKPFRKTPVFSSKMDYLVLNPTWTVPPGILNADVLPGLRKDPHYLNKKKISVYDQNGVLLNSQEINWQGKGVRAYTYRQPPGPDNALGAVKFMFPNSFSVYLHDTPSKELFNKTERAFSSGCIRVHEPLSLAEYLLNDSKNWNGVNIQKIIQSGKTQTVRLKEQPNVHLLYWTAWADAENVPNFRKDIYQRDPALISQLQSAPIADGSP